MTALQILLVNGLADHIWIDLLRRVVSDMGKNLVVIDHRDWRDAMAPDYDLILLDASSVADVVSTVRQILSAAPRSRLLVVTPTPHWRQAKEALLAGAIDYVRKVEDEGAIRAAIQTGLSRKLPQ